MNFLNFYQPGCFGLTAEPSGDYVSILFGESYVGNFDLNAFYNAELAEETNPCHFSGTTYLTRLDVVSMTASAIYISLITFT